MQSTEIPETDSAARVVPTPRSAAPWRVVTAEVRRDLCLAVTFADGTTGEVRLRDFVEGSAVVGTVFEALRDPDFFAQTRVELGAITWPNGADLAPDAMYDAICAQGHWTLEA